MNTDNDKPEEDHEPGPMTPVGSVQANGLLAGTMQLKHRNLTGSTGFTGWKNEFTRERSLHHLATATSLGLHPVHPVSTSSGTSFQLHRSALVHLCSSVAFCGCTCGGYSKTGLRARAGKKAKKACNSGVLGYKKEQDRFYEC
jgi:hypothetical protein